mgnify:CR=1 FL=1
MEPVSAIAGQAVGSLIGIGKGIFGGRKRRREERAAQAEFNAMKSRYQALDTSNPYSTTIIFVSASPIVAISTVLKSLR